MSTRRSRVSRSASNTDPRQLYEESVQEPSFELRFIDRLYRQRNGRVPALLREDFCGSAAVSAAWVRRRPGNVAVGVDLDKSVLQWAQSRHVDPMRASQQRRITLKMGNVLTTGSPPSDVLLALNFSYSVFKERAQLLKYFRACRSRLAPKGLLLVDAYGGSEAHLEIEEVRHMMGYTYVWHQASYNPVSGHVLNHLHFRFPDGSEHRKAFTYDWRLWSIPELRDVLADAGFRRTAVYWEGTDHREGTGNGRFTQTQRGEACEGWVAYIVAER